MTVYGGFTQRRSLGSGPHPGHWVGRANPASYDTFPWASTAQIASSSATASGGRARAAPAMFSRR
jgi:hypothetical protein